MANKRYHPPERIAEHPMIQSAFQTIGALLIATNAKDLEADFAMSGPGQPTRQYHIEVTEVADNGWRRTNHRR